MYLDKYKLRPLRGQSFAYLSRGGKVRAYASADGAVVLKTFNAPAAIIDWYALDNLRLSEVPWARSLGVGDEAIARRIYADGLASCRLAAAQLADETVCCTSRPANSAPPAPSST